jgi:predicted metal-dependent phosphoesterase TrpH
MALWNVDLHSHTFWSKDSLTQFERIIKLCARRKIDRIAITDHNTAEGALKMQKLAPNLVIVGEEIMTTKGELLAYYVKESVPKGLSPQETIKILRQQGAVISVAHPFDQLRKGGWDLPDLLAIVEQIDAVEVHNARCLFTRDNDKAAAFAKEHTLLSTAGSDAHVGVEYGRTYLQMQPFNDAEEFVVSLETAKLVGTKSPVIVHVGSALSKWSKKLGLRKRMWRGG